MFKPILLMLRQPFIFALLIATAPFPSDAFKAIEVGSTVTADQSTGVDIVNDLSSGSDSFDAQFSLFRLYLAYAPPGWGLGPACYLVNSSSINTTSFDVQIPASTVPSSSKSPSSIYSLAAIEFNVDPDQIGGGGSSDGENSNNDVGPSSFEYSDSFDFQGGTGNWSQYELDGFPVGLVGDVPCSAFDCARQCAQKYYPDNVQGEDVSAYKTTYECIAACPGVVYPPFDTIDGGGSGGGGDGGGDGDGDGSGNGDGDGVTISAATTGTSLAAAGGFTHINTSPTGAASATAAGVTGSNTSPASTQAGTASSTASASTPSTSKSAASLAPASMFNVLFMGFAVAWSLLGL